MQSKTQAKVREMKIKNPKTRKILLAVKRQILNEPRQFDVKDFFTNTRTAPNCGTTACIAGWTLAIAWNLNPRQTREKAIKRAISYEEQAQHILKLPYDQLYALFFLENWPITFRVGYRALRKSDQAGIAAKRIDYFLATGK